MKGILKNENKTRRDVSLISKITDNKGVVLDTETSSLSIEPFSQKEIKMHVELNGGK